MNTASHRTVCFGHTTHSRFGSRVETSGQTKSEAVTAMVRLSSYSDTMGFPETPIPGSGPLPALITMATKPRGGDIRTKKIGHHLSQLTLAGTHTHTHINTYPTVTKTHKLQLLETDFYTISGMKHRQSRQLPAGCGLNF